MGAPVLGATCTRETCMTYYVDANGVVHSTNTLAAKRSGK